MKAVLIYNSGAGSAQSKASIQKICSDSGITIKKAIKISNNLRQQLTPSIKNGDTVITVGGDGTQSAVAGLIAGTKAVLAPIPGGTLNHFTKDLGVEQSVEAAIKKLPRATVKVVDTVTVNDQTFINNSSIGLYPSSLKVRDRIKEKFGKWPAAVVAAFRTLWRFKTFTVTIKNETFKTPFVFIGNNEYKIDTLGAPKRTTITKGTISVFIAKTVSRWTLIKIALLSLVGKSRVLNEFEVRTASSVTIGMKRKKVHVSYDGEVQEMTPPLTYTSKAKSLRILV